jgi:hypothetical protein
MSNSTHSHTEVDPRAKFRRKGASRVAVGEINGLDFLRFVWLSRAAQPLTAAGYNNRRDTRSEMRRLEAVGETHGRDP